MSETLTEETVETTVKTEPQQQPPSKTLDELKAENERMAKALKDANHEAAERRKKLDDFEKAEQQRKDAELSEVDRLKKEAETLRAQAQAAERAVLQRDIAAEVGLPATFAARIVGATRDEMLSDAKVMLEALPKPGKPITTGSATNPGSASAAEETYEQKKRRLGLS